ncbi:extracellular solute-binding protein [Paenibacillus nasutitermitis]|uniref:Sugar ABC transporter substrate-binding protein n=1 Tax=Paenibacillus nasutitermitis TaxID=1652958 RepID=A0A917DMQ8_9BACL|nr:extracellular solute-binding protein [Paenibacillus nasutitermitis]GGD49295.1 sugar ABC transporter substrate-binding protein [Paenibacillus nasutitermitis]
MNGIRKRIALVLSLVFLLTTLAACSGNSSNTSSGEPQTAPSASTSNSSGATDSTTEVSTETAPFQNGKYEPAISINTVIPISDDIQYFNGETAEKNILFDQVKEKLGLDINVLWTAPTKNEGFKTKMLLSLSSGEKLPDVINTMGDPDLTNQLIDSGNFMDLTEAIENYASEDIKRIFKENPDLFYSVTRNGKIMALPIPSFGPNGPPLMYIRQDWLDKLGLKAPTTIDEMETVMDAFVNQDPDGNNKKDTFGLALQLKNPSGDIFADATALFGAFGVIPGNWSKSEDGQSLVFDTVQPGMKNAIAKLRDWMAKGLISKDAPQQDGGTATQLFTSGKAGIVFGPNWFPYFPLPDLGANVEGATYKVYPVPVGPDGKAGRRSFPLVGATILINKNYAHPDAVFKYAQVMYEFARDSGIWDMTKDKMLSGGYDAQGSVFHVAKYGFMPNYFVDPWYQVDGYLDYMIQGKPGRSSSEQESFDTCKSNPLCIDGQIESMKAWKTQQDADRMNLFVGPTTETQKTQGDFLSKLEYETIVTLIFGTKPLEDFEPFVEKWKSSGGDKITQEVNEWYTANVLKK